VKRILGVLGWVGVALVVAAVVIRFSRPELQRWSQGLALGGLIVTALYTLTQWRDISRSFSGRGIRYGSMSIASVVLMLGLLVGVNYMAKRHNKRWDLTAGNQFSLSDQTKQILTKLAKPLKIQAFYAQNVDEVRDTLDAYVYLSKQVAVDYVDAERNPTEAQKAEIRNVPTLLITYEGRTERAVSLDEQTVTNALKKVIEGTAKKLYFVQGHGEHDPTVNEPDGYGNVADALKFDNFESAPLQLAQAGKVPDDATVVVVGGPKKDLFPQEIDALRAFLKKGGKVLLLIDPPDKGTAPDTTGLIAFAHEWGIQLGNDLIVDASGMGRLFGMGPSVPIAMPVKHPITNNFPNEMTAFPIARSATPIEGGVNGHGALKFLETNPQSWAESDVKGLYATGRPEEDLAKGDKAGPIALGSAVTALADAPAGAPADAPKPESRMVVVGDSDFVANRALGLQGNREMFLNIANWLAQQEDLIAIRPKDKANRPVTLTADQGRTVWWFSLVIIPGLLLLNGVRVWWTRR
jgi:ABC-type uncharacterized transport system involved in gliding motility auxiliary subunit